MEESEEKDIKEEPFLCVEQSQGGIFQLPFCCDGNPDIRTSSIGTLHCWNCVCLYIPISEEICFITHIDAWVSLERQPDRSDIIPPKGSEQSLKDCVKRMLKEEVLPSIPNGRLTEAMKGRVIILNMRPTFMYQGALTKATGPYITEAIQEFFGLQDSVHVQHAFGFVVNHDTAEAEYFRWKKGTVTPTAHDYDMWDEHFLRHGSHCSASMDELSNREYPPKSRQLSCEREKTWRFGYHDGKWYSSKDMRANRWWIPKST